jgi:hypothetical protein
MDHLPLSLAKELANNGRAAESFKVGGAAREFGSPVVGRINNADNKLPSRSRYSNTEANFRGRQLRLAGLPRSANRVHSAGPVLCSMR